MNDRERFLAVVRGESPDYVPIFGFPGAPGVSHGAMAKTHRRLVDTGMPAHVDGCHSLSRRDSVESWQRFWGTTGPLEIDFFPGEPARGIRSKRHVANGMETIEYETGALTRQLVDNDITYSMPEFVRFHVSDAESWEFYRERTTPHRPWNAEQIDEAARRFDRRERPLAIAVRGTWGAVRDLMGPEAALLAIHDQPELVADIIAHAAGYARTFVFPVIERLRPEIVVGWEDMCYNHGMLISPDAFRRFCVPYYREIGECARGCDVPLVAVDCDGNIMELVPVLLECGVNGTYPLEVKAGNDAVALGAAHPELVLFGWLEKEALNEGNEALARREISSKVPGLLAHGRALPNADHGIQPLVTFDGMRRFMTLLHDALGNPEGEFPRL